MEVVQGSPHAVFPMGDASRVGEARRYAADLALSAGFDQVLAGRLALVVTELGTNLVKHAKGGRLLLATRQRAGTEVEVLAVDNGPGISDLARCMGDGFSTSGTPGNGLGAVRRLADDFDIHSSVPAGTLVVARVRAPGAEQERSQALRVGVVATTAPGETVSGDGWTVVLDGRRAALIMADGLGHGPGAEEAAKTAIRMFGRQPFADPCSTLELMHGGLRSTRGAAVTTALIDADAGQIRSAGAGNVIMRVVSGVSDKTLLSQNGTAGLQIRRPEEVRAEWPRHAVIVMHSDGVQARWQSQAMLPLLGRDPSLVAALLMRDFCRGHDDATVMVVRRKE